MVGVLLNPITTFIFGCFFGIFISSLLHVGREEREEASFIYVPENSDVYVKVFPKEGDRNG